MFAQPVHTGRKYKKWDPCNLGQNWWKTRFHFSPLHIHTEFRNCRQPKPTPFLLPEEKHHRWRDQAWGRFLRNGRRCKKAERSWVGRGKGGAETNSLRGLIATHQHDAMLRCCNVPALSGKARIAWRWGENSTGIKTSQHNTFTLGWSQCGRLAGWGLTKQPAIAPVAPGALCLQIFLLKQWGGFKPCLCLPAVTSLGCCEISKWGEGLASCVCS